MEFIRCCGCMRELEGPGAICPHCGYDNKNDPPKQPDHALPCGTVLAGRYVVGRTLGQGGFGITYIGWNLVLDMPVCIKEYFPDGAAMRSATQSRLVLWSAGQNAQNLKDSRESFVKEAQKTVKLRDLNHVVKVWDVFYENETAYIVMDYIEGETLRDRLVRTQKPLGEKECIELLTPVMEDLEKAHGRGIIHRDIKPDNIMLTAEGKPVLLDMGAAKDLGKSALNGGTPSSVMVVSQGFSPKEQYQSRGKIGPWTDVYAMCATICYCVSGKVPPAPLDRDDGEGPDLSRFSTAHAQVLEKGMALRAEDRIQSMGELCAALNRALEAPAANTKSAAAQPDEPKNVTDKPVLPKPKPKAAAPLPATEQNKRKSKLPLFLGAAAVAVLAIFGVTKIAGGREQAPVVTPPVQTAAVSVTPSPAATPKTAGPTQKDSSPTPQPPNPTTTSTPTAAEPYEYDYEYKETGSNGGQYFAHLYFTVYGDHAELTNANLILNVQIPAEIEGKPVTVIGDKAFESHGILMTSVTIPEGVTSIGESAFAGCSSLTGITFPKSVISIGRQAFHSCHALTSITIPEGVTSIEEYTFYGCRALTSITLPEGMTSIGKSAFGACSALSSITLPKSMTVIGENAFYKCGALTSITIPEGVASIEKSTFVDCSALKSITLPKSLTSIGDSAFTGCSSLTGMTIPQSVTSIGESAFMHCSALKSITIPEGVTSIADGAFASCTSLTSVTIPQSVTSIGEYAFSNCSALTSVTIPESVTEIGVGAFGVCQSLTSIHAKAGTYAAEFFKRDERLVID